MHKLFTLLIVATFTGCAVGPYPVSSPYYRIPVGSRLILKQPLTISANTARVYIQYGKVITQKENDQYYAHCWFLSRKVLNTAQTINPTTFFVTNTQKYEDDVLLKSSNLFASLRINAGMSHGGSLTAMEYSTELTITSDSAPDIFKFVCNRWEDPVDAWHLTVSQIQETLGEIAEIQLNTGN